MSTLSVCIPGASPRWMRAVSELVRPVAAEIVVAVDSRTPENRLGQLDGVVDRLLRVEYADPPERVLAWLHAQCSGDWILRLDNDEVPSPELVAALPRLIEDESLTHYWLRRRWVYPTVATYLDELPWSPNHDLRLTRNDPRLVHFPGVMHREAEADGPGAWLDLPVYHLDLVVNDAAARRQKAERYERLRPGMRLGGRNVNESVYLPESRAGLRLAAVPPEHGVLIRSVIDASDEIAPSARDVPLVTRAEIDAFWPGRPLPESAYRASIELASQLEPIAAGERKLLEARVRNDGTECWPWGTGGGPEICLSYHWLAAGGEPAVFNGLRTPLPHDLEPGAELLMPLTVEAPAEPGDYVLQLELVHEHNRWFGDGSRPEVRVSRPRKLALLSFGDPSERLVELAFERPEHEIVVLRRPRAWQELLSTTREAREEIAKCESLLVEGRPERRLDRVFAASARLAAKLS